MSRPTTNCASCGKPKAAPVTTQQAAPQGADWPTREADILYVAQQFGIFLSANQQQTKPNMFIPSMPLLPTEKQADPYPVLVVNNQRPRDPRAAAPEPPPLVPPKEAA
jgi:hypothetical protein